MTQPNRPLRTWLQTPDQEAAIRDGWQVVSARSAPRQRFPVYAMAIAVAAVMLTLLWPTPDPPVSVVQVPASAVVPQVLNLPDGSQLVVMPGALVEALDTPSGSRFSVVRGQVAFSVTPRTTDNPFFVQAGDTKIRVIGTRFAVTNQGGAIKVEVEHGRVRVTTRQATHLVGAGQQWATPQPKTHKPGTIEPAIKTAPEPEPAKPPAATNIRAMQTHGKARKRLSTKTPTKAPATPTQPAVPGVADLLQIADRQRANQNPAGAQGTLQAVLNEHPKDPRAGMAAFLLARIELENLSQPRRATEHLALALELGVPASLEQIVRGRLVEAWVAVGDRQATRVAARRYLDLHPSGPRASEIKRWAQ